MIFFDSQVAMTTVVAMAAVVEVSHDCLGSCYLQ